LDFTLDYHLTEIQEILYNFCTQTSHKKRGEPDPAMHQSSFFCPRCQQMKLFQRPEMNHTPHILAAVFLCGLWLPVWAIISATYNPLWRCSFCGFTDKTEYLADPHRRQREGIAAAEAAQMRAQIRKDREGSTIQERIAYFISDYRTPLVFVGVIAGMIGIFGIAVSLFAPGPSGNSTPRPANGPSPLTSQERSDLASREVFTATARGRYVKEYPQLMLTTSGPKGETLFISHPKIDKKFVDKFRKMENVAELKKLGFKDALITGIDMAEWRINF
jgi:hypothetical protein